MIPEYQLPDDMGASIRRLIASEPAYYAHKDQLFAGYQDAIAAGHEPTTEQQQEARRRKALAARHVLATARRIVEAELKRRPSE